LLLTPIVADPTYAGHYGGGAPRLRLELHQSRVGVISRLIALKLGFSPDEADQIKDAAVLHDIGKLFVPVSYLEKAGPLAPDEMEAVRQHPEWGHAILSGCGNPTLRLAALVALQHHENWDGTGYPSNLVGEEISIEARIVSICDIYDALREERSYRKSLPHEQTMDIIMRGDERTTPEMFDPRVLRVFLRFSEEVATEFDGAMALQADQARDCLSGPTDFCAAAPKDCSFTLRHQRVAPPLQARNVR